jgi:tRNA(adenine34) deaminase
MAVAGGHGVLSNDDVPGRSRRHALSQSTRKIPVDPDETWMPLQPDSEHGDSMSERSFKDDEYFMRLAMREAERALEHGDVPIGAVLVRDGELVCTAHNERELRQDPTAHAEIVALREAARVAGSWRVLDTTLYVTLEPCAMCAGAIVLARVPRVLYGASDPKAGACGSVLDVLSEPRLNHRPEVQGGLLGQECGELLSEFFASRR